MPGSVRLLAARFSMDCSTWAITLAPPVASSSLIVMLAAEAVDWIRLLIVAVLVRSMAEPGLVVIYLEMDAKAVVIRLLMDLPASSPCSRAAVSWATV